MLCRGSVGRLAFRANDSPRSRSLTTTHNSSSCQTVQRLPDWNLENFRNKAFQPQVPAQLPREVKASPAAPQKWFALDTVQNGKNSSKVFSLKRDFWSRYGDVLVPLELTENRGSGTSFKQLQAPLGVLLHWMEQATEKSSQRLYLAQCQLSDLPESLRDDMPTPELVHKAGKGDVYDANFWMGLAPTYTPLHRDPNPNLFFQLAGRKVVKLFPPDVGASIFANVRQKLGRHTSSNLRGEEMMQGAEKELLEQEVWGGIGIHKDEFEAVLDHGEALFIPLGWWHSVKGVGKGVTASLNWWFR